MRTIGPAFTLRENLNDVEDVLRFNNMWNENCETVVRIMCGRATRDDLSYERTSQIRKEAKLIGGMVLQRILPEYMSSYVERFYGPFPHKVRWINKIIETIDYYIESLNNWVFDTFFKRFFESTPRVQKRPRITLECTEDGYIPISYQVR